MNTFLVEQLIESTGFCLKEEIQELSVMKAGMTNRSYSFLKSGKKYIIRIPGEGTEQLINRYHEYDVYRSIAPLHISELVYYLTPDTGIKIASYIEASRPCDPHNFDDVQKCMKELRYFHNQKLSVDHKFDLWDQIEFYESLWEGQDSRYADYHETKKAVWTLRRFIDAQPHDWTLCHIDSIPDNFLFEQIKDESVRVKLSDWEYAGMQDPHVDIAMFAIYAMYDRAAVDKLIDAYFTEGCTYLTRMKIYCYIAISGLLWSNWCEFKEKCGISFGVYAQRQYEYAKEYLAYFQDAYARKYNKEFV